jgi:predicted ATPase
MNWDQIEKERDEARKQNLQSYVEMYGLGIRYYKEYGWDPVDIFSD